MGKSRRVAAAALLVLGGLAVGSHGAPSAAATPDCGRQVASGWDATRTPAITRDNRFAVLVRHTGVLDLEVAERLDVATGAIVRVPTTDAMSIVSSAISDDGRFVLLSYLTTNAAWRQQRFDLAQDTDAVVASQPNALVSLSGDGGLGAVAGPDEVLLVQGTLATPIGASTGSVHRLFMSESGRYVAVTEFASAGAGELHVYDLHAPVSLPATLTTRPEVAALHLTDDGQRVFYTQYTALGDSPSVWSMLWSSGATQPVSDGSLVDVTGDGRFVLVRDFFGLDYRWDTTTRVAVPMNGPALAHGGLGFGHLAPDGSRALVSSDHGPSGSLYDVPAGMPGMSMGFNNFLQRGIESHINIRTAEVDSITATGTDVLVLDPSAGAPPLAGRLTPGVVGPEPRRLQVVGTNGCTSFFSYPLGRATRSGVWGSGRVLDTRPGTAVGWDGPKPAPGEVVRVRMPRNELPTTTDFLLNITVDDATAPGYVTAYDCGETRPLVSSVNATPGIITANLAVAHTTDGYDFCLYTQSGAHLVVDIVASYAQEGPGGPGRWLDTRAEPGPKPGPGSVTEVTLSDDIPIALLNVTGVDADAPGFVTVYPCGQPRPLASNLNLVPGVVSANLVLVAAGVGNKVCLYTQSGAHLVVDKPLKRSFDAAIPYTPSRLLDTRESGAGKPSAGSVVEVTVPDHGRGAVLNITAVDADAPGFVTAYRCDAERPATSSLNVTPGRIVANLVMSDNDPGGRVCLFTQSSTHLVVDLMGVD